MAPIRKRSRQPYASPTSTKPVSPSSVHKTTTKQPQLPKPTPKSRPLPQFLNQLSSTLEAKYAQITAYESTNIITRPNAWHSHPISHTRDRYSKIKPWTWNTVCLSALNHSYINASPISLNPSNSLGPSSSSSAKRRRSPTSSRERELKRARDRDRQRERFIATQGPLGDDESADGLALFWEMVWQEGSQVIVMLTGVFEEGKVKCGVYFPEEAGHVKQVEGFGSVECVSKDLCAGTEVRQLKVVRRAGAQLELKEQQQAARTIWHLWFPNWPDNDIPAGESNMMALLELIKMSRFLIDERVPEKRRDILTPRIVHCSGGIGRTGTFIALDYLLQELRRGNWEEKKEDQEEEEEVEHASGGAVSNTDRDRKIDLDLDLNVNLMETEHSNGVQGNIQINHEMIVDPVYEVVMELREQRTRMVARPVQYVFIYEVLRKVWEARYGVPSNLPLPGRFLEDVEENLESHTVKRRRLSPRVRQRQLGISGAA